MRAEFRLAAVEYAQEYVDRGVDRIGLQVYPEPDAPDAPAVVIWPAMGVPARYYRPFAAELRSAGLAVFVADLRGTGASSPRPSRPCLLLGHSLGGQTCLLHVALTGGADAAGLVLVATVLPYWRTYPGASSYALLAYTQGIATVAALRGVWPGWGFGGRQARGVIRDWAYSARRGRYPSLAGTDPQPALAAMRNPVLAVSVDGDRYAPVPSLDHLCGMLAMAPVERVHYTTAEAGTPLDHFTWVRAGGPLARRVAEFAGRI